jgi:glycosyltransferase involved in cell wall biosynthesis
MKLTFVIDSLAMGGAQKHVRQMALGLAARGHQVQVISLNDVCHAAMVEPLIAAGIPVTVMGRRAMLCGVGLIRLWRRLRSDRPDLLITVLFASTIAGRIAATLAGKGIRIVTCVQARNINYGGWQFALLRLTARATARFFFNSRSAMPFALKHEGARAELSHYVANGVEIPTAGRGELARKWSDFGLYLQPDHEVIVTIGRLDPQKGYGCLLRAFRQVVGQREQARLLMIGAGPEEPKLRALAEELGVAEKVIFAGERADGPLLASLARLYVQPSLFEGTPNALMEAMAAGVPAVATAVDGVPEIVTHGVSGWLVPPNEPAALAEAVLGALRDTQEAEKVGRHGREKMLKQFDTAAMISRYEAHFLEVLEAQPAARVSEKE